MRYFSCPHLDYSTSQFKKNICSASLPDVYICEHLWPPPKKLTWRAFEIIYFPHSKTLLLSLNWSLDIFMELIMKSSRIQALASESLISVYCEYNTPLFIIIEPLQLAIYLMLLLCKCSCPSFPLPISTIFKVCLVFERKAWSLGRAL